MAYDEKNEMNFAHVPLLYQVSTGTARCNFAGLDCNSFYFSFSLFRLSTNWVESIT